MIILKLFVFIKKRGRSDIVRVLLLDVFNVRELRVDIHRFLGVVGLQGRGHVVTSWLVVGLGLFGYAADFTR